MRVIITGGKGFIGSHLSRVLTQKLGYEIFRYDLKNDRDVTHPSDLKVLAQYFRPDVIVHLAAQVYLGPSFRNPRKDAETNIVGTVNVLEAARMVPGARVVYSSSGAVYGSNDRSRIRENHNPEPISPYGLSKLTGERYVMLYNRMYGMDNVVFRFSSVYGPGRPKTSVNLILLNALDKGEVVISGDGNQTRDFTYVSDVVEALSLAVDGLLPPDIYNVGTGTSTSINDLAKTIFKLLDVKGKVKYGDRSKGDPLRNDFDVSKLESLGYKAKISLEDGLQRLIKVLREKP